MKEEIKRLVEEAEIYEDVEVLGQAQSDAVCMVKKLRAAIRETDMLTRENDKRARHAEQERDAFSQRIDEMEMRFKYG